MKNIHQDPTWYPFTQMRECIDAPPLAIAAGEGAWLIDTAGRRYLDGISSLWANIHGHCHPVINKAISDQLQRIAHTTMLGLTHPGGIALSQRLIALAPESLSRVFYSESGSTAVEIALKMAFQYWQIAGEKQRHLFIKLTDAYHGDTIGSVSVGGMDLFHQRFGRLLFETVALPAPNLYRPPFDENDPEKVRQRYFDLAEEVISRNKDSACGVIVEPIMQGAAGMILHPQGYLRHLRELTRHYNLLLIVDEVAVGFGRTGRMFGSEWEEVSPDLMCLGKGLTGGYLPLAATLTTEQIFSAYLGEYDELKTFFHGHTYTGNPLACAAALASLDVFRTERTLAAENFGPKADYYAKRMRQLGNHPHVGSVRFRGLMGGVELVRDKKTREAFPFTDRKGHQVAMAAREFGLIIRPLGDVVVVMPPLSITGDELTHLFDNLEKALAIV